MHGEPAHSQVPHGSQDRAAAFARMPFSSPS